MAGSKSTGKSLSHVKMKHYLLISRNIEYPLKEKLVTDCRLEKHLILELRDLSRPDVLLIGVLLAPKGMTTCHDSLKMTKA